MSLAHEANDYVICLIYDSVCLPTNSQGFIVVPMHLDDEQGILLFIFLGDFFFFFLWEDAC